ncbi:MAG: hypothetical protein PHQ11_01845 [Paludibacter sp.]|nr:hypothetical protein [Paludibacter sp.]MDD4198234.1 hypothetical protein [Paludibacter sp.]MDD4427295.1 hypothetical protein [Paludibacter sp.]
MKLKKTITFVVSLLLASFLFSQEKIYSTADSYFDFLTLDSLTERPYLNFRTLSDSKWIMDDKTENIWKQKVKIEGFNKNKALKIYNPEFFISYNGASPYGQNDGLLWQSRGLNAYFSAGVRFEKKGFELTFKPEIVFSENRTFSFMPPNPAYAGDLYKNKADVYGYYGVASIDAPQRFGNNPFVDYGWGDSEIRYSTKTFTVGIGSQYLWLGPAKLNPIIHSNNAPSYPRFDIGMRPTNIRIGNWNAGKVEARLWLGQLKESAYFDHNATNNFRLISGLSIAYAPSFFTGLTLMANRVFMCQWEYKSLLSVPDLFFIPLNIHGGRDTWDQRASIGFSYLLPGSGFEVFTEIGLNDYSPGLDGYIRYPFHSLVYTSGMRKSLDLILFNKSLRGELLLEITNLEVSQDFQLDGTSTFYAHHQIRQGYTNKGQWLGAGNGTGGNSQYLGFKLYHSKGLFNIFLHRQNPDNDYIYQFSVGTENTESVKENIRDFKAVMSIGIGGVYFIRPGIQFKAGISYITEHNPLYNAIHWEETSKRQSLHLETGLIYNL